jgi:site-specific DNA-methyltransferase (adenine-specific)
VALLSLCVTDDYDPQADSVGSYEDAIGAMRVKHVASQRVRVIQGNCLAEVPRLVAEGVVVDSIVCDPPYHLTSTVKRFGKSNMQHSSPDTWGDLRYNRLVKGFMGQVWDGGDIAFRPETWATMATILRPGGFLLAFGGTRTWHRLTCAIEDAGFVIQDTLMWLYGSGFPKRRDMLKPAFEPIILAYKPGGARTLQVDECRIPAETRPAFKYFDTGCKSGYSGGIKGGAQIGEHDLGRWPANVCLSVPEDEYELKPNVTAAQRSELFRWLSENP